MDWLNLRMRTKPISVTQIKSDRQGDTLIVHRLFRLAGTFFGLLALAVVSGGLLAPLTVRAQGGSTGSITGTVLDQQGAAVLGATVSVTNKGTGSKVRDVTTSDAGVFNVPLLPPGNYQVEVTADGFVKFVVENVTVKVTETANLAISLKIGSITETVVVTEAAIGVQTANAVTGQTIGSETVSNLPLSTRNFLVLLTLSAGANTELFDSAALGRGAVTINVNGQRPTNNNFQLEGINANDFNLPILTNVPLPNPEAVQEFKTQTSLYDASQGRNGGGNIQVALKSGGSQYHGSLYEFFRNDVLNANDFFLNRAGQDRPVLRQNQYGGSVGGPVWAGANDPFLRELFFHFNYQGTRQISGLAAGTNISTNIPVLPADRSAANLQAIFFPSGLPASATGLDPVAVAFLNLPASRCPGFNDGTFCIPSLSGSPGFSGSTLNLANLTRASVGTFDDDQYTISIDKQLTAKDKLTGRWFSADFEAVAPFGGASSLPHQQDFPNTNRFLKVGWTRVFSNRIVNEARFGFNRFTFSITPQENILLSDVGATRGNSAEFPAAYRIAVSGAFSLGTGVNDDRFGAFNTFVYADDFTINLGKHLLRAGVEFNRYQLNRGNRFATRGSVAFANTGAGAFASGDPALIGFQNFLLGRITGTQGGAGFFTFHFRAFDASWYVQDDWKIHPRLTLNLGLRWEGLSTAYEEQDLLSNFQGNNDGTPGPIRIIHPESTANVGTPGVSRCTLVDCFDNNNFAPRVSFAWDVFGNQKTVLRSGYGIYYQRTSNQPLLQTSGGLPFSETFSASPFSVSTTNPFPSIRPTSDFPLSTDQVVPALVAFRDAAGADPRGILATNAALAGAPIFLTASGAPLGAPFFFPQRSFVAPYAQQWNLTIQHEFYKGWILELGYVGTKGTHLIGTGRPFNPGQICTTAAPCRISPEVGASVAVAAGTPGVTKLADGSINITQSTAVNINARVPQRFLGLANSRGFFQGQQGDSNYHALQATVSRQVRGGLYFQGAYTFSKSIDNGSGSTFVDELNGLLHLNNLLDPNDNRGLSDFDRTHRLVVSYNYDLPFARFIRVQNRGFGKLVHGWAINGVTTFQSGTPFLIADFSSFNLQDTDFQNGNRATVAPGTTPGSVVAPGSVSSRIDGFLDLSRFIVGGNCVDAQNQPDPTCTATGFSAFGNYPRNVNRGPFQQNWDMSLIKSTPVTERVSVDFRTEFFNVWNHPAFQSPQAVGGPFGNYGIVDVSTGDSSILATVNRPRIIQFALKVNF